MMTKQDFYELLNRMIGLGPIDYSDMPDFEKEPVVYQQWERKRFHRIMKENEDAALPFFIQALYSQAHKEDEGDYSFLLDGVAFFYGGTKHAQTLLKNLLPIWEIQNSDWTEKDIMEFARDIYLQLIEGNINSSLKN